MDGLGTIPAIAQGYLVAPGPGMTSNPGLAVVPSLLPDHEFLHPGPGSVPSPSLLPGLGSTLGPSLTSGLGPATGLGALLGPGWVPGAGPTPGPGSIQGLSPTAVLTHRRFLAVSRESERCGNPKPDLPRRAATGGDCLRQVAAVAATPLLGAAADQELAPDSRFALPLPLPSEEGVVLRGRGREAPQKVAHANWKDL